MWSRRPDNVRTFPRNAALLVLVLGAAVASFGSPSFANSPTISLSRSVGPPTTVVTVAGSAFASAESVVILFDRAAVSHTTTNASGSFSVSFRVPTSATPNVHVVTAVGQTSGLTAHASFLVRTDWSQFRFDAHQSGSEPFENVLDTSNVSSLSVRWSGGTANAIAASPVVAGGVAYISADDGRLYAFPAEGCGGSVCTPLWRGATGSSGSSIMASPVVADGVVYLGSFDHKLYAFEAGGCGALNCNPLWVGPTGGTIDSAAVVSGGVVYVSSFDGKLYAFPAAGCGAATCSPLWTGTGGGGAAPSLEDGIVYVESDALHAFSAAGCGAATCSPLWTGSTGGGQSTPAVVNGVVYVGSPSKLFAFSASGCGASSCSPLWTASTGEIDGAPAVAKGAVYVATDTGSGAGKLFAFSASGCGASNCSPLWTGVTGNDVFASPAVAGGVVYAISDDGRLHAFDAAGCGGSSCSPIWTAPRTPRGGSSPAVVNGEVYVGSGAALYNYGLP
jgi:outer membrane protein assembly factor BamB